MTMKEMREGANEFGPVKNRGDLKRAVPLLVDYMTRLKQLRSSMRSTAEAIEKLSEKCSNYALQNPTCFDEGLSVSPIGVTGGDITIGGKVYHFASGYDTPVRIDGECLTQGFLSDLPTKWTKASLKLDTTAIDREGVTIEQLEEKGLFRPAKNQWSVKKDVDLAE